MTHPHSHDPGHETAVEKPFSDTEWATLQLDDLRAGKAVIGLMMGIFSLGLVLYFIVAMIVWASPIS